jgi:HSP20 family protein
MVKKRTTHSHGEKEGLDIELGGLFRGLGDAVDLIDKLVEVGKKHAEHQGEFDVKGLGDKVRGVYGFSIRTGLGGAGDTRVEPFGNVHTTKEGIVVDEVREPLVDVFDEDKEIVITAELPGARESEITIEVEGHLLKIKSHGERSYAKDVPLPAAVDVQNLHKKYNNGILEVRARKI